MDKRQKNKEEKDEISVNSGDVEGNSLRLCNGSVPSKHIKDMEQESRLCLTKKRDGILL